MKKSTIDKEVYLNYYNMGLSDVKIASLMHISNSALSRFRNTLQLAPNRPTIVTRRYNTIQLTPEFAQVLIGTIMGDGSLELNSLCKAKNARLRFGHCIDQYDYLSHKVLMLNGLWSSPIRVTANKVEISSISHPILTSYYNRFYSNGVKILPSDLEKDIDTLALATLYMDDGSYDISTNSIYISLCNFTRQENEFFIEILKHKFNIDSSLMNKGKVGKKYVHIYIKASSRNRFKDLIRPHLIPSMLYKIGE